MNKCKKIKSGKYEYKNWYIVNIGYYHPEGCVCWEGINKATGCADYHSKTKSGVIQQIDEDIEDIKNNKVWKKIN